MTTKSLILIALLALLASCRSDPVQPEKASPKQRIAKAKDTCGITSLSGGTLQFDFNPVVNNQHYGELKNKVKASNLGDFEIITTLLGQDLCLFEHLTDHPPAVEDK